jgi:hypothetical protein
MTNERKCLNCDKWKQRKGMRDSWKGRCKIRKDSTVMDDVCDKFKESAGAKRSELKY